MAGELPCKLLYCTVFVSTDCVSGIHCGTVIYDCVVDGGGGENRLRAYFRGTRINNIHLSSIRFSGLPPILHTIMDQYYFNFYLRAFLNIIYCPVLHAFTSNLWNGMILWWLHNGQAACGSIAASLKINFKCAV
jgi:hypothetical protein